jgi:hypothetical protein
MISIKEYELVPDRETEGRYYVRSKEQSICPICSSAVLKVIGSRNRKLIKSSGDKLILIIRRLRCGGCKKLHHELPDIIVPYKRYSSESIEIIVDNTKNTVSSEESTICRIRKWFKEISEYFARCLDAIAFRCGLKVVMEQATPINRMKAYVGNGAGWLAGVVRNIVNTNLWVHTRSAFLT